MRAIVVHDLADDGGGIEAGKARDVDAGFGVTGADEHAAFACATSGKTWPGETMSSAPLVGSMATAMVCARSCAEMPVVTPSFASMETVKAVFMLSRFSRAIMSSCERAGAVAGERQADQAAADAWP